MNGKRRKRNNNGSTPGKVANHFLDAALPAYIAVSKAASDPIENVVGENLSVNHWRGTAKTQCVP